MSPIEATISENYSFHILRALRRIIRMGDIHSRKLLSEYRITSPQMICLYTLANCEGMTQSDLAKQVDLGASTITGIVDRLEAKGYVVRIRNTADRRKVTLQITDRGREVTCSAPGAMQDRLLASLRNLPETEQATIAAALDRVLGLMAAEHPGLPHEGSFEPVIGEAPDS